MVLARVRAGLAGLILALCASTASAQTAPTLTGSANGLNVSLSWTAVAGATGYQLLVSLNGSAHVTVPVGPVTAINVAAPPGAYQIAVRATAGLTVGPPSNILPLTVTAVPPAPPGAPTDLGAAINGNSVLLTWNLASPSGLLGLVLQVGSSTGGSDLGTFPIRVSTSAFLGTIPNGNYFMRLMAVNAGGASPASNELNLAVPSCVAPASIPLTSTGQGNVVNLSWPQVPGVTGFRLDVSSTPGGAPFTSQNFPPTQTGFQMFGAPQGTYYVTLSAILSCGATTRSVETQLVVTAPVRLPAKGLGETTGMVAAAAAATPGIGGSCGSLSWLFNTLRRLRQQDNRFGMNWKRGNFGDPSHDVIVYNYSELPDDQARAPHLYAWDVIGGHCGPSPAPQATNISNPSGQAAWTILPYLQAGYTP